LIKALLPIFQKSKGIGVKNMDKYENHTDRRIKELHERMSRLGKRKKLA
jgi:hypothetical protein